MKTITMTEFRKTFKNKEDYETVQINPYFNLESWSAKAVHISDRVSEITEVTYRRKPIGLIIPRNTNIGTTLQPHYDTLVKLLRVDAPVISVFTPDGRKIAQVDKPRVNV